MTPSLARAFELGSKGGIFPDCFAHSFIVELNREGIRGPTRPSPIPHSEPFAQNLDGVAFGKVRGDRLGRRLKRQQSEAL